MKADDVFVRPSKWQMVSRATAMAIHWRVPVVVVPGGSALSASWFDELSPYFSGTVSFTLNDLLYFRYLDAPPADLGRPTLGPAPTQCSTTDEPVPQTSEQRFWIQLVVIDEWGDFVPNVGVSIDGPGSSRGGGSSDAQGRVVASNLAPGNARVTLEKNLFFTDESKAGTLVSPAETTHTMLDSESLGSIARQCGAADGRSIYYYPANAGLKGTRAALGLVQAKDQFKVPRTYTFEFPTKPDGEAHEYRLKLPAMLDITKVDAQLAPSKEKLDIAYDIALLSKKKVILEISSAHLEGGSPLFKTELDAAQKSDGSRTFRWDRPGAERRGSSSLGGRHRALGGAHPRGRRARPRWERDRVRARATT
jgi:hypothetical protein